MSSDVVGHEQREVVVAVSLSQRERRWFILKRPRCDTNEESEKEVTVT